jgi:hypothetical protein
MFRLLIVAYACLLTVAEAFATEASSEDPKPIESLFEWTVGDPNWISPAVERDRIVTDRPHISEATSLVGLGHIQLETGYSFFSDGAGGTQSQTHSFPEPLLRWGILAEWFELRLGYNYLIETQNPAIGPKTRQAGSEDMLLAAKLALAKQRGWLPDLTVFPQTRLPTGAEVFSADQVLPGVNIAYSWAVNRIVELECNTVFNKKRDDQGHYYVETLQTANVEYDLGDRWMAFTEYLAFMPSSSLSARFEHYFHIGVHYFVTPNFQIDLHSAVGLNEAADNLAFTGIGLSWKH